MLKAPPPFVSILYIGTRKVYEFVNLLLSFLFLFVCLFVCFFCLFFFFASFTHNRAVDYLKEGMGLEARAFCFLVT